MGQIFIKFVNFLKRKFFHLILVLISKILKTIAKIKIMVQKIERKYLLSWATIDFSKFFWKKIFLYRRFLWKVGAGGKKNFVDQFFTISKSLWIKPSWWLLIPNIFLAPIFCLLSFIFHFCSDFFFLFSDTFFHNYFFVSLSLNI